MIRVPLRLCLELSSRGIVVSFDGSRAEREDALAFCPELPRLLNDAMANLRRHYQGKKVAVRGAAAAEVVLTMAARLRERIATDRRADQLDVSVRAIYERAVETTERVDAETGRTLG